ncbi:MAG: hypothetical protein V4550_14240 [Gemmatimonadota bacterium]
MTALTRLLFPVPALRRSPEMIFAWWESRRPVYNLIVGGTGLVTLASISVIGLLPPHPPLQVPWQAVVLYGVLANVCYSFGFAIEALLERLWGNDVAPAGPLLFRQGLAFGVGLTLLPIGLAWVGYLVALGKMILG